MKNLRLKENNGEAHRVAFEAETTRREIDKYRVRVRVDDNSEPLLRLTRRQALKLRDWITNLEMYGTGDN